MSALGDALEAGFLDPPASAKPRTWWHWTGGNVTKDGITKDLEWMKRVGIGGFQLADVATGGNQSVEKKIEFATREWFDAVRHAAAEADRLGLEMSIFSSAGWSETGGPWVKPDQAMKKLVWSETRAEGPQTFNGQLPLPPTNNGPIRNLGRGGGGRGIPVGRILASDDGTNWQTLAELPGTQQYRAGTVRTFAFPEVIARFFRVEMTGMPLDPAATIPRPGCPHWPAAWWTAPKSPTVFFGTSAAPWPTCSPITITAPWRTCCGKRASAFTRRRPAYRWKSSKIPC